MRPRLTYANVMTTIAIFLALGGATAFAATQLAKKSVGTKQLKANAVTTAKIKKAAVTRAKIKAKAVDGSKIADGSVTGTEINSATTNFSRATARFRSTTQAVFTPGTSYSLGNTSFNQNAGEDNFFIATLDVNFAASCEAPRSAEALLLLDAADPTKPAVENLAGIGGVTDNGTGAVSKRIEFQPFVGAPMGHFAPTALTAHNFSIFLLDLECKAGSGATVGGAAIDVLGVK